VKPPPGMIMDEGSEKEAELSLSGRSSRVERLNSRDVHLSVDLSGLPEGRHFILLSAKNVQLPSGVRIDRISPQRIQITLKRQEEKTSPETPDSF
jgi:hypothetical protein